MAAQEPGQQPSLTALPRLEDLPKSGDGYDPDRVREAFESFRRHSAQLQAQLRVLQAASRSGQSVEPTGHAVRMDALHLIRTASEFADTVEADAQKASEAQLSKTEEEVRRRRREQQDREAEIERYRQESERQRAEMLNAARNEARELLANANRDATQELREAEAKGNRLLEQSRHQATELTNSARAEVEQTLEWARAQASAILGRAQTGAEQLLAAAGLGEEDIKGVGQAIVDAVQQAREATRTPPAATRPAAAMAAPPVSAPPLSPPSEPEQKKPNQPAPKTSGGQSAQSEGPTPSDESQDEQQP
jgi:predicted ribosome quality control (RQC) complex YloA/Tae2 family protein